MNLGVLKLDRHSVGASVRKVAAHVVELGVKGHVH